MKIYISLIILLFSYFTTFGQVKFGASIGLAIPSGKIKSLTETGISAHGDIGIGITQNFDLSFFYQIDGLNLKDNSSPFFGTVYINSFLLNGRYFLIKNGIRPYASLGVGISTIDEPDLIFSNANGFGSTKIKGETKVNFSFRPAVGFKYGILNIDIAYLNAGNMGDISVNDITLNLGMLITFGNNK